MISTPTHTSAHLSATRHQALLARLASDDAFRARLASDPVATLAAAGLDIDATDLPSTVALPGKDELRALLAASADPAVEEEAMGPKWFGLVGPIWFGLAGDVTEH